MNLSKKIVLLDRDGVINLDSEHYVKTVDEFILLPGSIEALVALKKLGFSLFIITNQSGIGRGYFTQETLEHMHTKLNSALQQADCSPIDQILYCPHTPEDQCHCRKPKTGMLEQLSKSHQVNLTGVPFVGDSIRDLQAAINFGAQPVLVKTGNGQKSMHQLTELGIQAPIFNDLLAFSLYVKEAAQLT